MISFLEALKVVAEEAKWTDRRIDLDEYVNALRLHVVLRQRADGRGESKHVVRARRVLKELGVEIRQEDYETAKRQLVSRKTGTRKVGSPKSKSSSKNRKRTPKVLQGGRFSPR